MRVTAIKHQSLADLVLQETGSIEGLVAFSLANGVAVTYLPTPGEKFVVPESLPRDKQIFDYYRAKNIRPVSIIDEQGGEQQQQFIENGFVEFGFTE